MIPGKPPSASCLLAWTLTLALPLGLLLGLGLPWWQRLTDLKERLGAREEQLFHYDRLLASLPRLKTELDRERNNDEFKAFYYEAETPALAGAQLQRELQDMVQQAGARLVNAQFLAAGAEEQPPRVRIRTQIQGENEALLDLLFAIEQARPFLFVDQLSVRSATRRPARRRRGRSLPPQNQDQLTIRLDVFGYSLGGGAPQ